MLIHLTRTPSSLSGRPSRVVAFATAALVCVAIAAGMVWLDEVQFELGYAYESGSFHGWTWGFSQNHDKAEY
jgi:hypothetical protein